MIPFPKKKYSVIYADPPWNYAAGGKVRNVERHYRTMKPEDIYSLPVQDIAEENCLLFLWATFPNLDIALETIRRWGIQYKTAAFVWVKRNRKSPSWFWGMGNWTRANAEICLLGVTGPEEWIDAVATAYCPCEKCCGKWALNRPDGIVYTASGAIAQEGVTIAADWSLYPPGTVLYIEGIGERTVQDRGGVINGQKIDIYFESHEDALQFGRQDVRIRIVKEGKSE